MMTAPEETNKSSPALIELAVGIRSQFNRNIKKGHFSERVIVKADEVAKIYYNNSELITAAELDILYEILREFGIVPAHVPQDFHVHVSNVIKFLEKGDRTITKSHVSGLIFARM